MFSSKLYAWSVICILVVVVLSPILYMFFSPLWGAEAGGVSGIVSLFDQRQLSLALTSMGLAGGTACISLVLGLPLAMLVERSDLPGGKAIGIISVIPLLIPPYIHAIIWSHFNQTLTSWGLHDLHCLGGAVLVLSMAYFPIVTILAMSGLKSIDGNQEEAALLSHESWPVLRHITLPLVKPHILSGMIFVFIFALVDFGVPDILRVKVYPVEIFIQFSAFYDEQAAMILSLPLMGIAFLLVLLQKWNMGSRAYIQVGSGVSNKHRHRLGRLRVPALCFSCGLLFVAVGLPLAVLLKMAGPLSTYGKVLSSSYQQICYSLLLAGSGAMIALLYSFSLSYLVERTKMRGRNILELLAFMPLAVPAVTLGIGLIQIWNRPVIDLVYSSSLIIIIGYVAHYLPFSVITLSSGLKQLNPRLEEAGWLNAPRKSMVVQKIVIPLLKPSLLTAFFIVFLLSFGDLGTTLLVIPPGRETIPIKIYNLMHYGAEQMVAALSLLLVGTILFFAGLFFLAHKRARLSIRQ